jgi:hypothetical protein
MQLNPMGSQIFASVSVISIKTEHHHLDHCPLVGLQMPVVGLGLRPDLMID